MKERKQVEKNLKERQNGKRKKRENNRKPRQQM